MPHSRSRSGNMQGLGSGCDLTLEAADRLPAQFVASWDQLTLHCRSKSALN